MQVVDDVSGEVVSEYPSITEASSSTGIAASTIWKICIGVETPAGGLKWRFTDQSDIAALLEGPLPLLPDLSHICLEFDEKSDDEYHCPSIFERTGPKQVEQIDAETGKILNIFPSGVAAGRAVGIGQKAISDCCHGRRQTSGGFRWRFHQVSPDDETQYFNGSLFFSPPF